jgi:hypothetical protein
MNLGCKAFLFFFLLGLGYMFFYLDEGALLLGLKKGKRAGQGSNPRRQAPTLRELPPGHRPVHSMFFKVRMG